MGRCQNLPGEFNDQPFARKAGKEDEGGFTYHPQSLVFLDYFDIDPEHTPAIGFHPHSGITAVTVVLEGRISYEETSGSKRIVEAGGKIHVEEQKVPGMGKFSLFTDPEGRMMGLWKAKAR